MQLKMLQTVHGFTFFDWSSWGHKISWRTGWPSGHFSIEGFLCRKRSSSRLWRTSFWFHLYRKILFRAKIKRLISISFVIILLSNNVFSLPWCFKDIHYNSEFQSQIQGRLFLNKFHRCHQTFLVVFFKDNRAKSYMKKENLFNSLSTMYCKNEHKFLFQPPLPCCWNCLRKVFISFTVLKSCS